MVAQPVSWDRDDALDDARASAAVRGLRWPPADDGEQVAEAAEVQSLISLYLHDAARYPTLSAAEERELSRRIREDGDVRAEETFILANLRLVVSVAREYPSHGLSLLDLVQEGNIGLMKAVKRYDGRKGFRFSTYAVWWIRQQITRAIWSSHGPLKVPTRVIDEHRRAMKEHLHEAETTATADAVIEATPSEPAPWNVIAIARTEAEQHLASLPAGEDDNPMRAAETRDLLETIYKALASVNDRDQQIIAELFGLDDKAPIKLEQVAQRHKLTCERVRQIKRAAFDAIRRSPYAEQLAAY